MQPEYIFDLSKIIEASLKGDQPKVRAYAEQFVEHLKDHGDSEAAETIYSCLKSGRAKKVNLARSMSDPPIPVDGESRMPLADTEVLNPGDIQMFLATEVRNEIDQFARFFRASAELAENGVGISPSMLLYGPPGCGKTQLARFMAAELGLPLITARTDGLISSYLGSTAKNIRLLFEHAASRPCILFLDEFDALAKMRDDSRELGELKRVVISLLQNIDALSQDHVLLAATNHDHLLDPAIWRRFSFRIHLVEPDYEVRSRMLSEFLGHFSDPVLIEAVAALSDGLSGAHLRQISENAIREAILSSQKRASREATIRATIEASPMLESNGSCIDECARLLRKSNPKFFTQDKIASLLNISQTKVCRLLKTG